MALKTTPLPNPKQPTSAISPEAAAAGPSVPPIERLRHMSPAAWEDFILEWVHAQKQKYARVEKHAGSGDQGLDVIAFETATSDDPWHNYQCKHYDHALHPGDVWVELGKLVFYTFTGEYSVPASYQFVAPQGAGTTLSKLLRKPEEIRSGLLEAWDKSCRSKITSTREIVLDDALKRYIDGFDFRIVSAAAPLTIIDDHRQTPFHVYRFGGGLPARGAIPAPPTELDAKETKYIRALLDAYEHRLGMTLAAPLDLDHQELGEHFTRSRREFYSAESLREFSRDNVPPGTFESLLDDVHSGVVDVEQAQHADAVARVLAVVQQARVRGSATVKVVWEAAPPRAQVQAQVRGGADSISLFASLSQHRLQRRQRSWVDRDRFLLDRGTPGLHPGTGGTPSHRRPRHRARQPIYNSAAFRCCRKRCRGPYVGIALTKTRRLRCVPRTQAGAGSAGP
ncbi:MAG TPA: ABC-three component system protein [Polyangiaceae bacterium]|nr:ABC-three component system protein [Polyangiaceae bacterium]